MHRARITFAVLVTAVVATSSASAATRCVLPENSCPGMLTYANLQSALSAANSAAGADKILLGAATYQAPTAAGFTTPDPAALEIAGKGATSVLTAPAGASRVLDLSGIGGGSKVHDLKIHIPASFASFGNGLMTAADAAQITVDADASQTETQRGIYLINGADLAHSSVTLDNTGDVNAMGVLLTDEGSTVTDTSVTANLGYITSAAGSGVTFDRVRATAHSSGFEFDGPATVRNCLVQIPTTVNANSALSVYTASVTVSNCTLVGAGGAGSNGIYVNGVFGAASADVSNTVIRGMTHSFLVNGGGHPAALGVRYSDFDPAGDISSNGGQLSLGAGNGFHPAAGFADEPGGDYDLLYSSPLVDAGDPATAGAGADIRNYQRKIGAVIDIGAYEYPRQSPEAEIDGPSDGVAGVTLTWTGSASDPDLGETALLTYGWRVDGGALQTGATLEHSFVYGGTHHVVLTVFDPAGADATVDFPVVIDGPAPPAPPADPAPANDAPPSGGGAPDPGGSSPDPQAPGTQAPGTQEPGSVSPGPGAAIPAATGCLKHLRFTVKLDRRLRRATVRLAGKRLMPRRAKGRLNVRVDLRGRPSGVYRLHVDGRTAKGKRVRSTRRLKVCA